MPRISEFYGIAIEMIYADHAPPHFHARYGEFEAIVGIERLAILQGELPTRARRLVVEWAGLHRAELEENWLRARRLEVLVDIDPLP